MTDDEAVVNMVDANLQRETILPSERAFAYKMKLVASREDALHELTATLRSGDASGVREWLQNIVNEDEPDETTQKAAELMAIEAVAAGKVNLKGIVTNIFDFDDIQNAMDQSIADKANIVKAVVRIGKEC